MPGYEAVGRAKLLRENSQVFLWENEIVPASATYGSLSLAVQLERVPRAHYPWGFSVEVAFAADPGAFEVDVMVSDTDNFTHFIQWTNITQVNSYYVGRVDVLNSWPKYVALYMKTLTNPVLVSGQLTR